MSGRREFSPHFKVQVVLEALKGERSQAQICRQYNISCELLRQWKKQFLERAHLIFTPGANSKEHQRIAELERLVGKLTYELSVSKKYSVCRAIAREEEGSDRDAQGGISGQAPMPNPRLRSQLLLLQINQGR